MVELSLKVRLETAEWHVTKTFEAVARQRLLIFAMNADDPNLGEAERQLSEIEQKLARFTEQRDRLVNELFKTTSDDDADSMA
jgi:hypothetical protein